MKLLGGKPNEPASSPSTSDGFDCRRRTATRNQRSRQSDRHLRQRSLSYSSRGPSCKCRILVQHHDRATWFRPLTTSTNCRRGSLLSTTRNRQTNTSAQNGNDCCRKSEYVKRAGPDSPSWETVSSASGDTNAFPHTITGGATAPGRAFYTALDYSPFTNDLLVSFAQQAIINEQLGQDDDTDVLTVSFSANDYVGHRYGPYSQEVMDVTLQSRSHRSQRCSTLSTREWDCRTH